MNIRNAMNTNNTKNTRGDINKMFASMFASIQREPDMVALGNAMRNEPSFEARKQLALAAIKEMDCYKEMNKQGKDGFDKFFEKLIADMQTQRERQTKNKIDS